MPEIGFESAGCTFVVRPATGLDKFDAPYMHSLLSEYVSDGVGELSAVVWGRIVRFTNVLFLTTVTEGTHPAWLVPRESSAEKKHQTRVRQFLRPVDEMECLRASRPRLKTEGRFRPVLRSGGL